MKNDSNFDFVVPVSFAVGAVASLIGYGAYSLWRKAFPDHKNRYDSKALLASIAEYSPALQVALSIMQEKDHELTGLMLHCQNSLTEEEKGALKQRQISWQALTLCIRQRPIISEHVSRQHEADQQSKELDEYISSLNRLKETFLSDHDALIRQLQAKQNLLLRI